METIVNMASKESEFIGIWLLDLILNFHLCLGQVHLGLKQSPYVVISIIQKKVFIGL